MKLVNWDQILSNPGIKVSYSSLAVGDQERDEDERDIVQLELPGNNFIDVGWVPFRNAYSVTLYHDYFENKLRQSDCKDANQVIECVQRFANIATADEVTVTDSETVKFQTVLEESHSGMYSIA